MKKFFLDFRNWKLVETRNDGPNGIILPTFQNELGKDPDGKTWFVRVKFRKDKALYEVGFDFSEDGETPFLKHDVIYADNYARARALAYSVKEVKYDEFPGVVRDFVTAHNIN